MRGRSGWVGAPRSRRCLVFFSVGHGRAVVCCWGGVGSGEGSGESRGAVGWAKWVVRRAVRPHVCCVVLSASCGRCSLFAPVVGYTGGCPSRWTRRRFHCVARAFVRGTDAPLWFPCTPLASSPMAVLWCGLSPGGHARLAQAISSALSTWVKTKATLRVRFASPSRRVLVVCFLSLALSTGRGGPWRGVRPCVGSGVADSLALCRLLLVFAVACHAYLVGCNGALCVLCPCLAVLVVAPNWCHCLLVGCPSRSSPYGVVVWPFAFRHQQGDLDHYRNVENIWTFYLKNAVIKLENVEHRVDDRLRIIACDGRTPTTGAGAKKAKK